MSVKKYRRAVFLIIMLILTIVFYFIFCGGKNAIGNVLAGVINGAGNFPLQESMCRHIHFMIR